MAKSQVPSKKMTKAERDATKTAHATGDNTSLPKKTPKEKGPVPATYSKNKDREQVRWVQAQAATVRDNLLHLEDELVACRACFLDIVNGVPGKYTVGLRDMDGNILIRNYTVEKRIIPIFGDKPVLVVVDVDGIPVLHKHLFTKSNFIQLSRNTEIGDAQADMLDYLREALAGVINQITEERKAAMIKAAADKAATLISSGPKLVTSDGKAVKPSLVVKSILSLCEFAPTKIGKYDFSDGAFACMVELVLQDGKFTLVIRSIHQNHQLAQVGVRVGLWIRTESIGAQIPEWITNEHGAEFFAHATLVNFFITSKLRPKKVSIAKNALATA